MHDFSDVERAEWLNRLGNLVLIGRHKNAALGRKQFAEKKRVYFQNHVQPFPNSIRVMQYATWTPTELQDNHARAVDALRQWYK